MTTINFVPKEGIDKLILHHIVYEAGDQGLLAEVTLSSQGEDWDTSLSLNFSDLNEIIAKTEYETRDRLSDAIGKLMSSPMFITMLEMKEVIGRPLEVNWHETTIAQMYTYQCA